MDEPELKTVDQFDAFLLELNNKADALSNQAREVRKRRDIVFAQETMDDKVKNMGAAEREALRRSLAAEDAKAAQAPADQTVAAHGIGSSETVAAPAGDTDIVG